MKRSVMIFAFAALATFLSVQNAAAFPGERIPYRAAQVAQKVAYKVDNHVVRPARRVVVRHAPR